MENYTTEEQFGTAPEEKKPPLLSHHWMEETSKEVLQVENNGWISAIERLENLAKVIPYKGQINKAIVETYHHAISIIKEEFAEPPKF